LIKSCGFVSGEHPNAWSGRYAVPGASSSVSACDGGGWRAQLLGAAAAVGDPGPVFAESRGAQRSPLRQRPAPRTAAGQGHAHLAPRPPGRGSAPLHERWRRRRRRRRSPRRHPLLRQFGPRTQDTRPAPSPPRTPRTDFPHEQWICCNYFVLFYYKNCIYLLKAIYFGEQFFLIYY